MTILLTGSASFIDYHLSRRLLQAGHTVIGFDNLNSYYEVSLKESRLKNLSSLPGFTFTKGDLADANAVNALFARHHLLSYHQDGKTTHQRTCKPAEIQRKRNFNRILVKTEAIPSNL